MTANCPNRHADPIYVNDTTAECAVCGVRYDAETGHIVGDPATAPNLTPASFKLFMQLAWDAGNWSGNPLLELSPAERGNLTQLKIEDLITTIEDDGCVFAVFTEAGVALATANGIDRTDLGIW